MIFHLHSNGTIEFISSTESFSVRSKKVKRTPDYKSNTNKSLKEAITDAKETRIRRKQIKFP